MAAFLDDVAPERRYGLFRDVMTGIGDHFDSWATFNGHQLPVLDIMTDAGVVIEPFRVNLKGSHGFSVWERSPHHCHPTPPV